MTALTIDSSNAQSLRTGGLDRLVRTVLFLFAFILVWLTASPFPDLADPKLLEPVGEGDPIGQALAISLTVSLAAFVYFKGSRAILQALTPVLVLTFLCFACSVVFSAYSGLAARRLVLAAFTIFQASAILLVPRDRDHFSRLLAIGAIVVLTICYVGIIFLPELSIHQSADLAEPDLEGNWRGFFTHKNGAGAGMVVLVFIGIFIFRAFNAFVGALIISLAGVFLVFTESKSSIRLLPLVLIIGILLTWIRNPVAKFLTVFAAPAIIAVFTIGSVIVAPIHALVDNLLSDPTFTGRDDIWRFALDHIAERPIFGFGFQAFWGTSELVSSWNYQESWGYRASDAHNGFLNLAVMTGLVGLLISMAWIIVQPLLDHIRTPVDRIDPALNMLFLQIWLFGLCLSGFESDMFSGGSVLWFMMVMSIVGLRYQANGALAAGSK